MGCVHITKTQNNTSSEKICVIFFFPIPCNNMPFKFQEDTALIFPLSEPSIPGGAERVENGCSLFLSTVKYFLIPMTKEGIFQLRPFFLSVYHVS